MHWTKTAHASTAQKLAYTYSSFDWCPTQQASAEAPVVETVLFAFSDLSLYLSVKQPGSSRVSWHLNSFTWPASPWDWSDLNAEAFKRTPSCIAEQLQTDNRPRFMYIFRFIIQLSTLSQFSSLRPRLKEHRHERYDLSAEDCERKKKAMSRKLKKTFVMTKGLPSCFVCDTLHAYLFYLCLH